VGRPPVNDEIIEDIYTVGTPLHPIKIGVTITVSRLNGPEFFS
jgi:hypothetical protein